MRTPKLCGPRQTKYPIVFVGTLALYLILFGCLSAKGQTLPSSIRGYKVQEADVKVLSLDKKAGLAPANTAIVNLGETVLVDLGLSGATIEVGAEITAGGQSGRIDLLTFRDFNIGGIPVEIDDYDHPFSFKKTRSISLPSPIRVFISLFSVPKAVYRELTEDRDELKVTGTVFVFGKFKKMGFKFKCVVPVKIDMTIKNPLRRS